LSAQDGNDTRRTQEREGFETLGPGARVSLDFWWKMKRAGGRSEGSRKTRSFFTAGPAVPAAQPVTISGLSVAGVQTFYPEVGGFQTKRRRGAESFASGTRDRFEARYLGERGFIDRIDGDSCTCPLEPIAPAGDGTDRGHAGAADIFEIDLCTGHGLGPRCLARRRRPKLTRGRRRFSDTRRLSTAASIPVVLVFLKDWPQINFVIYHAAKQAFLVPPDDELAESKRTGTSGGSRISRRSRRNTASAMSTPRSAPRSPTRQSPIPDARRR
jgi:hypothetical protein